MKIAHTWPLRAAPTCLRSGVFELIFKEDRLLTSGLRTQCCDSRRVGGSDEAPLAILLDELKNENIQTRINAIRRLQTIAKALGPEKTRSKLLAVLQGAFTNFRSPKCISLFISNLAICRCAVPFSLFSNWLANTLFIQLRISLFSLLERPFCVLPR